MAGEAAGDAEVYDATAAREAIADYVGLQFAEGSELRRDLVARLADDAAHDRVAISDVGAHTPAHFTTGMVAWYSDHVAFPRGQAIERVKSLIGSDRPHNGSPGCLFEAEREAIEDRYIGDCRTARQEVRQRRRVDIETVAALDRDIAQHQAEFAALRDGLGREPTIPNSALYLGVMFLVGIAEAAINYDSFRALAWATPAIALGTTFAIGMMLALAAHMHGTLLKRFRSYFDDDIDVSQRWVAARMFAIGTTGLTLALAAVAYARNVYFIQTALGNLAFGGASSGQRLAIVGGSLLGNMIVYLIGVLLAFLMHDEVARYAELRLVLDRDKAKRDALVSRMDIEIAQQLRSAAARRTKALEQLQHRDSAQRNAPQYIANRKLVEQIVAQDSRVLGALQSYRSQLCLQKKTAGEVFSRLHQDDRDHVVMSDGAGYLQLPLALKFN